MGRTGPADPADGPGRPATGSPDAAGGYARPLMPHVLLALHAHPDDESSKGAGTVARYAAAGVRCVLVTATGGEAGDILNPAMDRPEVRERLPEVRRAELDEAVRLLGYDRLELLGYRDSGMPGTPPNEHPDAFVNADYGEVVERVVRLIREERPQVVVGYDDHVRYPHPDHLLVHRVALDAFEAAADPARFPGAGPAWAAAKLYAPVRTWARLTALHEAMLRRTGASPLAEWLERRGDEPDPPQLTRIDVTGFGATARAALAAHRTQVDPEGPWFAVPLEVVEAAYPYEDFELLATRVGPDRAGDDLFEAVAAV